MEPILAALEVESFGKPVRVEFTKTGGVISHTIFLINGDEKVPVLTSRINAPGLPCFTELHQQDELLFLTGADGPCHWSMSVSKGEIRNDRETNADQETLQILEQRYGLNTPLRGEAEILEEFLYFDVACRVKDNVDGISSGYTATEFLDSMSCENQPVKCGLFVLRKFGLMHVGSNPSQGQLIFRPEPKCVLTRIGRQLSISSPFVLSETFPTTARWSFAVGLVH